MSPAALLRTSTKPAASSLTRSLRTVRPCNHNGASILQAHKVMTRRTVPHCHAFSTHMNLRGPQQANKQSTSTSTSNKSNSHGGPTAAPGEPEIPSFSLDSLGLSKNMKMLVIGIICVFGTIETWFWCQTIWRWWKGEDGEESAQA